MTYTVTFTDEDGKRRTEIVEIREPFNDDRDKTLAAWKLGERGHKVQFIHSMTKEPSHD